LRCHRVAADAAAADNQGQPIKLVNGTFEGDKFRPELEGINAAVRDTQGRAYPGNSRRAQGEVLPKCYNEEDIHLIRITDSCPCTQVGEDRAVPPWQCF
jgi:hypothetical protein